MFCISIKTLDDDSRTFYNCPKCSARSVYFIVSPEECEICGQKLPDPDKLEVNIESRYDYYINSEY